MPGQLFVSASGVPSKRAHKKRGGDPYGKVPCPDLGAPEPAGRGHTPTHTLRVLDKLHGFGYGKISGGAALAPQTHPERRARSRIQGAHPGAMRFCPLQNTRGTLFGRAVEARLTRHGVVVGSAQCMQSGNWTSRPTCFSHSPMFYSPSFLDSKTD